MQITHQEARRFIQMELDGSLHSAQKIGLMSHLQTCADCRTYADSMKAMERTLRPLLQRQWNQQPIPLSITALSPKTQTRIPESMVLATRIAAVSIMFVAFLFSAWQLSGSNQADLTPILADGPAMPPASFTSTQGITATTDTEPCAEILYVVPANHTLAEIAQQFSIDQEELLQLNDLSSESVSEGMKLIVRVCGSTPTGTVHAVKTTYMPLTGQVTSTPTGY